MQLYQIGLHIDAYPYENSKLNIFNKNTGKTFVLGEKESGVFKCLNGANSIKDIHTKCPYYSEEEIEKLIAAFVQIGLFEIEKRKFNPFKIKMRLFNPNRIIKENSVLNKILHYFILFGCPIIFLFGILLFRLTMSETGEYVSSVLSELTKIKIFDIIIIIVLSLLCLSLHEFAHTVSARRYGVNVPEIGIMLYFLIPCAYTNISGINLLKSKGKRLIILLSGSLINLAAIGICFGVMALIRSPFAGMYASILILSNLCTIFTNTMVLLKFDGYYVLETILDEPNLRENAITHLFGSVRILFDKNNEHKKEQSPKPKDDGFLLLHLTYCFYGILSVAFVPFVLLNTVVPFFMR